MGSFLSRCSPTDAASLLQRHKICSPRLFCAAKDVLGLVYLGRGHPTLGSYVENTNSNLLFVSAALQHPVSNPRDWLQNVSVVRNKLAPYNGAFYASTTNRDNHTGAPTDLLPSAEPQQRVLPAVPFTHPSSYQLDFCPQDRIPAKAAYPPKGGKTAPFGGYTVYTGDYVPKPLPPRLYGCKDRPWMNCDSCPPSQHDGGGGGCGTAAGGDEPDNVDVKFYEKASGMKLYQARNGPYAIGNKVFSGVSLYSDSYCRGQRAGGKKDDRLSEQQESEKAGGKGNERAIGKASE